MDRRQFFQYTLAGGIGLMFPRISFAASPSALSNVQFNSGIYNNNKPQVILVFLYGGASELAGNFTNYDQFKGLSQSSYENYFEAANLQTTQNGFWRAAGGDLMEELTSSGDLNVLRTCYSAVREKNNNKSHGPCVLQSQRGSFDITTAGIFSSLAEVLRRNSIVDANSVMPFLSMEGDSGFFAPGELKLASYLRPLNIHENLTNPYKREYEPEITAELDQMAQDMNPEGLIKNAFSKRSELEEFINSIVDTTPANANYPDNGFARKLQTSINIMSQNPESLIISTGSGGLGGWDDHDNGQNFLVRHYQLMQALRSAAIHLKAVDPNGNISIIVMGEFGRGVNLNSAKGWDHGNLQSMYVLRGGKYFRNLGVHGTTAVDTSGRVNRLYLKPAEGSYWFEPNAVAASIYRIFGVTNPEVLTDNIGPITPLLS